MMKKLNEEGIIISDPMLANKYLLAQRSINDRLKKKAQLDKEIIIYKQQMAAVEKLAIKKQVATIKATEQVKDVDQQNQNQNQGQNQNQENLLQIESLVPTFEEFMQKEKGRDR